VTLSPKEDTIAAISTPPGEGGIGIVRLSGPEAIAIAAAIFASTRGADIRTGAARVYHGEIHDNGDPVDEVLVHLMRAPRSYTCEDVVEINAHGGAVALNAILELALAGGARLASAGEFTYRAFINGRIDLVQAEAVIDRIQARSRASLRAADAAAHGALSKRISAMAETLTLALARIEAAVDFPDDDLPELVDKALLARIRGAADDMADLLKTAHAGRLLREGAAVAIAGRPNVGKSSLFNALLRETRAIVTKQPGTTRDLLEETLALDGVPVRLIDTAGLRDAQDEAEQMGIAVARDALKQADIIVLVLDASVAPTPEEENLAQELAGLDVPLVLALNKSDLAPDAAAPPWDLALSHVCALSAKTGDGLHDFEAVLGTILLGGDTVTPSQGMVTRIHQRDSLRRAHEALERLLADPDASPEFLSIEMRDGLGALGEITGETTPDDILEHIFGSFCIGK
jgi:tRNA modification GTPase